MIQMIVHHEIVLEVVKLFVDVTKRKNVKKITVVEIQESIQSVDVMEKMVKTEETA
jgi:uncharacterized protein (DUF305 family)